MGAEARPHVVLHVAVSLDGATVGFQPDVGRFYELAAMWREDVTLTGADTILAQEEALASADLQGPAADGPLLAVVDGRARVGQWRALRDAGHWSAVLALHSEATPPRAEGRPVEELVLGSDRVDLRAALAEFARRGAETVRVDSGGGLNGALLSLGLADEVSLLVHPVVTGDPGTPRWYGAAPYAAFALDLMASETFDGGVVRLRYRVR